MSEMNAQATASETETTDASAEEPADQTRPALLGLRARFAVGVVAAALIALAYGSPLWEARLTAPQYPQGLHLTASGEGMIGDLKEITELNHYVGMRPYDEKDIPELALWLPTVIGGMALVVVSTVFGKRLLGRLARLGLWMIPVGILVDIQFRLYQYGHDIEPGAALRLEPFTPKVLGPTQVMNFNTFAYPGRGLVFVALAALLLTFAPRLRDAPRALRWLAEGFVGGEKEANRAET